MCFVVGVAGPVADGGDGGGCREKFTLAGDVAVLEHLPVLQISEARLLFEAGAAKGEDHWGASPGRL
jgi:hypothetical protein